MEVANSRITTVGMVVSRLFLKPMPTYLFSLITRR